MRADKDQDIRESFFSAMRRLAASVTVITAGDGTRQAGLTATAVCSLSADPPSLIACVNQSAGAHDLIANSKRFAVNLLSADQEQLATLFADPERAPDRFKEAHWHEDPNGVPILEETAANIICRLEKAIPAFTHTIFIGVVEDVKLNKSSPLLYGTGSFGRFNRLSEY
ncbi:MAG: flavin reductase family protein [Sphingomonadales bacterium]|jgi:flavin reductase (DIM6/NTAB) family NADH-FMN oxidoreductase RutF